MEKMLVPSVVASVALLLLGCSKDEAKTTKGESSVAGETAGNAVKTAPSGLTLPAPTKIPAKHLQHLAGDTNAEAVKPMGQPGAGVVKIGQPGADDTSAAAAKANVVHASAAKSSEILKADAKISVIDIRTAEEFGKGHIDGALNVDFFAKDFSRQLGALDRSKTYVMHCQSGGRSGKAIAIFQKLGFEHIVHMDGGMIAWEKSGLPTTK